MASTTDPATNTNERATRRREQLVVLLAAVIALMLVSVLITRTSQAAFTATTNNTVNDFVSGTLLLENAPDGTFGTSTTAKFSELNLIPGSTGSGCIDVRYGGSVTAAADLTNVVFYTEVTDIDSGGAVDSTDATEQLSDDLDLAISVNDGTCAAPGTDLATTSGTLAFFNGAASSWDSTWKPTAPNESRAFEFTWTLGGDTAADAQGDRVEVDFVWEINTP